MSLSTFLDGVAQTESADSLHAAIVFVMLDRPLDKLIAYGLANGPHHRGRPSPWSHCFLLTEPYRGPKTQILDCTIRGPKAEVLWDATLPQIIDILLKNQTGSGDGGVYDGSVADYDQPRVTAVGVKCLPGLAAAERDAIVAEARQLQSAGYKYDLSGPLRELVRLFTDVASPPPPKRLFSSAFVQKAYRAALGPVGDFNGDSRDEDTTGDDIWYSSRGLARVDQRVSKTTAPALPANAAAFAAGAVPAPTIAALETTSAPSQTRQELERVLAVLNKHRSDTAPAERVADLDRVRVTLENALSQLIRTAAEGSLGQSNAVAHSDDYDLSLVLSAMTTPPGTNELAQLYGRDLAGFSQYEDLDAKWIASLWNRLTRSKVPFPTAGDFESIVYQIPDNTTIALAGDWGTGNASSLAIASEIAKLKPDITCHLGDVYYSGTESEELERFVNRWPAGSRGSLALNSNHEMYSGGHGYFGVALPNAKFRMQRNYSYFALSNKTWLILGLDSAHGGSGMYSDGVLNQEQMTWLKLVVNSEHARAGFTRKNLIVLTHHQGIDMDGSRKAIFNQVLEALGQAPHRWYWGHVHGTAAFKPIALPGAQLRARLVGHGGVPYGLDPLTPHLLWTETERANDPKIPQRGRNGFCFLEFSDIGLEETFYDEYGNVRYREP